MPPASFMQMKTFLCNIATCVLIMCCFHLLNLSLLMWLDAEGNTQKGTCNLYDKFEETEVDHMGHNFAPKYCRLKLAGSIIMKFHGMCWVKRIRCLTPLLV